MITFDYLTLKAFYEENKSFFKGARLQKIQQPTRRDFLLTIRGHETRKLYINISPEVFHICFLKNATQQQRDLFIPQKPPMFCMLLRKYLEGARIIDVNVPYYERIFEIYFEVYNELNDKIKLCLAVELMGKYSNVILYNCDTNIIIGCAHNVGAEKSRDRELAGTLPYIYPPKQNKTDILRYNSNINYSELNKLFMGISASFQNQLAKNKVSLDSIKDYIELKTDVSPAIEGDEYSIYSELFENPVLFKSVNDMIDTYFAKQQEYRLIKSSRLRLKNIVYPKYKKQRILIEKLNQQLTKKDNASKYKKYADLLISNIYNLSDYQKVATVLDWETNKTIIIPLDDKLSLKENSQRYYQMYAKSKNAKTKLVELFSSSKLQADYLEGILYSIDRADTLGDLHEIEAECDEVFNNKTINLKQTKPIIEPVIINGYKAYVGKNNKQNDFIISKLASPNDLWFHIHNCPGSHVLLKISDNVAPDDATIYECCRLAKKYSSAAESTKAGVIYTMRKYIKKPPKANLGYATYKNEKEIIVE